MTVSSTNTKNSYSGNGSTTVFAYTFKIFDDDDITVILRTDATGGETVQTKTTDYTVSGVGNAGGGNITFGTAPASGITVVLLRETAQTQATDYTPNDPFPAASHEDALDKLTLIIQDQQEELDRAIKVSRTNTITSSEFTVGATDRANRIFAFDSSGDLSVTQEIGTYQGTDTTTTTSAYQERDLIKSTTAGQLNNVYICIADSVAGDLLTDTDHFELIIDAVTAATSATNAAASATAAAASETAAAASESAAATSESNAATSESNASTSATNAATSATASAASASAASTSETNAATSATNASTSATAAASSATAAASSATAAAASESAAATSETNAATSATNAATSETNAATSETNAATSATNAATSATNAATAQTAAEAARDAIQQFYLGAQTSNPTVDGNGDPVTAGDWYFNTTDNTTRIYDGSAWNTVSPDLVGDATPQLGGNLDVNGNDITGTGNIDVTGTVTADGLTVQDASAGRVLTGIFQNTTNAAGTSSGISLRNSADTTSVNLTSERVGSNAGADLVITGFDNAGVEKNFMRITEGNDISFYDSTGVTQGFFWDADQQRLGIGNTSPGADLHISSIAPLIRLTDTNDSSVDHLIDGSGSALVLSADENNELASSTLRFKVDGTERMRIDSSGNVGIAKTNPSTALDVTGTVTATAFVGDGSGLTGVSAGGGTYKGENGEVNAGGGDIFRVHQKQLDTSVTIDADENALCAGPLTLATGVTVTVTSGGTLVIA